MAVDVVGDGASALEQVAVNDYDIIVLDRDLPVVHGDEVCRRVVRDHPSTRVLMLTASRTLDARVGGFELGADDYLTKPFGTGELLARVRAALRTNRYSSNPTGTFRAQDLTINYERRKVFVDGQEVRLTQTEYNIMAFLSVHAGKVLTYAAIIRAVWGYSDYGSVKKLQVNMKNIRKKMGVTPGEKRYIINELGVGYRMLAEDEA